MKLKLILIFLVLNNFSFGQKRIIEQIDSIVQKYHEVSPEVGISVGFIHQNQEFYTAYGNLSRESEIAINKNSVFEIASITKIITANLIAQAVEEGKFQLNDFIDQYLPESYKLQSALKKKIKISDLASHQSGLPDINFPKLIAANPQQPISSVTKETLIDLVNETAMLSDYGKYRYSTLGYVLLGQLLEKAYSTTYDDIIREKIISPLQLSDTYTKNFDVPHSVTGYNPEGGTQELFEWNVTAPAGLLKSNTSDMVIYLKAILDTKSDVGKAALLTEQVFFKEGPRQIGLGLGVMEDEGQTLYMKSGDSMGQSSILCYNRNKNWGVIIFLNQRNHKLRQQLLNEIYETVLK
ncbi:serine hydrolase domain-containing protein [uncultured Croceitalea sp.]|uniref:serine hydrolase domain-containing protein n=1 Tax=uncultured Croceitalea sp. TaxID=1798908 RepID=UPI00374F2585